MKTVKINDLETSKEMFGIGELRTYGDRYRSDLKRIIVFVDMGDRPFATGGTIGDDFAWRRTHESPLPPQVVLDFVKDYLKAHGHEAVSAFYSRKAGCSMCPCSPGYIIRLKDPYRGNVKAIWITSKTASVAAWKRRKAQKETEKYEKEVASAMGASHV